MSSLVHMARYNRLSTAYLYFVGLNDLSFKFLLLIGIIYEHGFN